jgi:hypothetical protein
VERNERLKTMQQGVLKAQNLLEQIRVLPNNLREGNVMQELFRQAYALDSFPKTVLEDIRLGN